MGIERRVSARVLMDLYQTLHVAEDATREEIRAAYLHLVQESHPDRRNADPDLAGLATEARFKRVQEAFEILYDPARRAEYDRTRRQGHLPRRRPVVVQGGPVNRRDIPVDWLRRSTPAGRARRRRRRWILLVFVIALVVACFSLGQHLLWRRLTSRAVDRSPILGAPSLVPKANLQRPADSHERDSKVVADEDLEVAPPTPATPAPEHRREAGERPTAIAGVPIPEVVWSDTDDLTPGYPLPAAALPGHLPFLRGTPVEPSMQNPVLPGPMSALAAVEHFLTHTASSHPAWGVSTVDELRLPLEISAILDLPLANVPANFRQDWSNLSTLAANPGSFPSLTDLSEGQASLGHFPSVRQFLEWAAPGLTLDTPLGSSGVRGGSDGRVSRWIRETQQGNLYGAFAPAAGSSRPETLGIADLEIGFAEDLAWAARRVPSGMPTRGIKPRPRNGPKENWQSGPWQRPSPLPQRTLPRRDTPRLANQREGITAPNGNALWKSRSEDYPPLVHPFSPPTSLPSYRPAPEAWLPALPRAEPSTTGLRSTRLGSYPSGSRAPLSSPRFPQWSEP